MKPNDYKNLEIDQLFKRHYLAKILWWKNFLLVAPSLLIFIGLAGVLYILQGEDTNTWYVAPYAIVFLLGVIWLKGIKTHLQGKLLKDKERFLVCAAREIGIKNGHYYFIFAKDSKRHNETLINRLAQEMDIDQLSEEEIKDAKKQMIEILTNEKESNIYLKAISISTVQRTNSENIGKGITPLLYISKQEIFVIRRKDLPK